MVAEPIGWWNTGFPILLLASLAVVIPWRIVPSKTRAQAVVALSMLVAATILLLLGAGLIATIYTARGTELRAAFETAPYGVVWFFLRLSGLSALAWGPVLALVWLAMAQRVERLKGEDLMHEGRL